MSDSNAAQWDEVRTAFSTSIMVDTSLASLAENLDGPEWPTSAQKETPADYIDLNHDEAVELLVSRGHSADVMAQLIEILSETLAFDDPFGDMVEHSAAAAQAENPILDNLKKLEIPADYPIALTSLSKDAKEFCELEQLATLSEFAVFAQGMSQNVIVGGDFKTLLNALSHVDEKAIARFLPFRPGTKGLHLIEALGGLVRNLRDLERQRIAGGDDASIETTAKVAELTKHFTVELEELKARSQQGVDLNREIMVLQDPAVEPVVARLLAPYLGPKKETKKQGWFGRLLGRS